MSSSANPLVAAKAALAHANKVFPSGFAKVATGATKPVVEKPEPVRTTPAPALGQELGAKAQMVGKANSALPHMHTGGSVKADGAYQLKAGEHVLTAPEAAIARKHALMFSGLKSLAKAEKTNLKKES